MCSPAADSLAADLESQQSEAHNLCCAELKEFREQQAREGAGEDALEQMPWVITKDVGTSVEDLPIPDLQAFLEVAQLEEHLERLQSEGLYLDEVQDVTADQLEDMGMEKFMHRRRFLRYAQELHMQVRVDPAEEQAKKDAAKKKAKDDYDSLIDGAAKRARGEGKEKAHDFGFVCTEVGRKAGAC